MTSDSSDSEFAVDYSEETNTYTSTFDSGEIDASMAVVRVMTIVCDAGPLQLDPLYDVTDPDRLDSMCDDHARGRLEDDASMSFTYHGHRVTVKSYGLIEVEPRADEA